MYNMYELKQTLENEILTVIFTKADGSIREMKCTLRSDLLPKRELLQEELEHARPLNDTIPVWDVEANGWRSFKIDSVKSVKYDNGEDYGTSA